MLKIHYDLNPIELIWAQIKADVSDRNKTLKIKDVNAITEQALQSVTAVDWQKCIAHTTVVENTYIANDGLPPRVQPVVIDMETTDFSSQSESE